MLMKLPSYTARILQINYVLIRNILFSRQHIGIRLRKSFEELGPISIKIGQLISTRIDLIPEDICYELAKLQDMAPAFNTKIAIKTIEKELNDKLGNLFQDFCGKPLAAASIAQVHAASMADGQQVVVKILRPKVKKQVTRDMEILQFVTKLAEIIVPKFKKYKAYAITCELKRSLLAELDLLQEAANASHLKRNFSGSHILYIPKVIWSHTSTKVLTLERVNGTKILDIEELKKNNTDLKILAERGIEIFFTQVFRDRFFHADLHPGNIWVNKNSATNPSYIALDYGIVGSLSNSDQYYIAENLLAIIKHDYRRVAKLHVESGWVCPKTNITEFETAMRCVCEPIMGRPLKDISFATTLGRLLQIATKFKMNIQPQLILLQKSLVNVEGIGRQLYPDLDLWHTALPFLEQYSQNKVQKYIKELPNLIYKRLQTNNLSTVKTMAWQYFIIGALGSSLLTIIVMRLLNV